MNFPNSETEAVWTDLLVVLGKRIEMKRWISMKDLCRRPRWKTKTLEDMFGLIIKKELPTYYQDQTPVVIKDNMEVKRIHFIDRNDFAREWKYMDLKLNEYKMIIGRNADLAFAFPYLILKIEEVEDFEKRHGMCSD